MTLDTVIMCLTDHGCTNVTDVFDRTMSLDDTRCRTGGFGEIHLRRLTSGALVAVKVVKLNGLSVGKGKLAKRMARELYVAFKCRHEHIIHPIGFIRQVDRIALVYPWVDGGTLREYVNNNPNANRYRLSTQVAQAVAYLHTIGTIHGDIKGANIMVSADGITKLSDFGNARSDENSLKFTATTSGVVHSTRWAAPELFDETAWYSREADVYALAMTILEAVTGQVPFAHIKLNTAVMCFVWIKKGIPSRPTSIPANCAYGESLWSLLTECWNYEPSSRPNASRVMEMMLLIQEKYTDAIEETPD